MGKTYRRKLSFKLYIRMVRYQGISPAYIYIEAIVSLYKAFLKGTSLWVKTNASDALQNKVIKVPINVLAVEIKNADPIPGNLNITL